MSASSVPVYVVVGGGIAGQPRYTFTTGPGGRQYAVGGEVSVDTSPDPGNPEATIRKMEQVTRAALAPTELSSQDRRVAADAETKILSGAPRNSGGKARRAG